MAFRLMNLLVILCMSAALIAGSQAANGLQCQRIAVTACQGLGYNMTAMPNLAGHTNQLEAEAKIAKYLPLIESGCSKQARFLICSSLFPLCTPDVPRPVAPCKTLCETVHSECSKDTEIMQLWPDFLTCETLPQPEKHELCMQIPQETLKQQESRPLNIPAAIPNGIQPAAAPSSPQAAQSQQQLPAQPQHLNLQIIQSQPPAAHPATHHQMHFPWMSWKVPNHLSKPLLSHTICPANFTVNPLNFEQCVPQCNRDAYHTSQQKKIAEGLILGLSAVCFVLTLFSLVTFWAEPTRFGYPERPVLFLCLCYNLFSVCYLERIVFHNSSRALAMLEDPFGKMSLPCTITPPCLASYITTSYLSLSAATWWLIFALCFYLSSHKKWSSEALEKKSGLFHVLAWVPPLASPISALLLEKVKPNELTGMCSAPGFVEIPALILLLIGLILTLRASHSLHVLQQQMQPTFGHQRFSQIRKRFLIFSLLFFIPTIVGVSATFLEAKELPIKPCASHEDCHSPDRLIAWPALIRIFFQLSGGTLTGMWVWSRKTCESYRSRLVALPQSSTSTTTKSITSLPKKQLYGNGKAMSGPLYSGISFHNVPVYNPNQLHV